MAPQYFYHSVEHINNIHFEIAQSFFMSLEACVYVLQDFDLGVIIQQT